MGPRHSERIKASKSSKDSETDKDSNKRRGTSPQPGNLRHGPGPTTSAQGGQAADDPSLRRSGAPFDAYNLSDRELQKLTTGFAALSTSAYAPPPSGFPAWEPPSQAPGFQLQTSSSQYGQQGAYPFDQSGQHSAYTSHQPGQHAAYLSDQPEQYPAYLSHRPGQYGADLSGQSGQYPAYLFHQTGQHAAYLSDQPEQYPAYLSHQPGQYGAYLPDQSGQYSAYPSNQPGQHNAHESQQARFYQKPIAPRPYLSDPPVTGMGTASAAPVGHQPKTRDPTRSRRATTPQPSLGEEPRRGVQALAQHQSRHWEDAEDEELIDLRSEYANKEIIWWPGIAKTMYEKFGQNITPDDCSSRWELLLNERGIISMGNKFDWSPDAYQKLIDFHEGIARVRINPKINHIAAAKELNKVFNTDVFTARECEKAWLSKGLFEHRQG